MTGRAILMRANTKPAVTTVSAVSPMSAPSAPSDDAAPIPLGSLPARSVSAPSDKKYSGAGHRSYVLRGGRLTQGKKRILKKDNSDYILETTQKINWEQEFHGSVAANRRIVEIGFGNGADLIKDAIAQPNHRFVGIETYLPGIADLLLSVEQHAISNIRQVRADAASLFPGFFNEHSLDAIRVFFPDPWPKRRHHKRRLLKKEFLTLLILCLRPSGKLHIVTDWHDYAEEIDREFKEIRGTLRKRCLDRKEEIVGKYGQKARREGREITEFLFTKN